MNATARMHKFTPEARHVIASAQQEAERLGHEYIGTEHMLLGLLDEQESKAAHVLAQFHVDAETVQQQIWTILNTRSNVAPGNITIALGRLGMFTIKYSRHMRNASGGRKLTRRVQKCIHFAVLETEQQHSARIDTEHLLLGVVREGGGLACTVLKRIGVDLDEMREAITGSLT